MDKLQKIAYIKALIYIATAEDKVEDAEIEKFTQLGELYGLTEKEIQEIADSVIKKDESLESILGEITDRTTKLLFLYDLLAIFYVDNYYSGTEKSKIRKIAGVLGIEESKLAEMENVMIESVVLQKKN